MKINEYNTAEEKLKFPLSFQQNRIWILTQLYPESNHTWNILSSKRLIGSLNIKAIKQTIALILRKHNILRSCFNIENNIPYHYISKEVSMKEYFQYIDLPLQSGKEDVDAKHFMNEQLKTSFNLHQTPIIKFFLIRIKDQEHILCFNVHHIIFDAYSINILWKDIFQKYRGFLNRKDLSISRTSNIQYEDYVRWQLTNIDDVHLWKLEKFWRSEFDSSLPVLQLPTDYPRPDFLNFDGEDYTKGINGLFNKIELFSKKYGSKPFFILIAAYYILLSKYSQQEDFIVGISVAGRKTNFSSVIGFFVNTLPLRINISQDKSFKIFLNEVTRKLIKIYDNQDYQYDKLIQLLNPDRKINESPLIQVMFNMSLFENIEEIDFDGLEIKKDLDVRNKQTMFDLTLNIFGNKKDKYFRIIYNPHLFNYETIEHISENYICLLENIIKDIEKPVFEISCINLKERNLLLKEWNKTEINYTEILNYCTEFEKQVRITPYAIAVEHNDNLYTYDELNKHANQLARFFIEDNPDTDNIVGICMNKSYYMIVSLLAVMKSGNAFLLIDPSYPMEHNNFILKDSNISRIISTNEVAIHFKESKIKILLLDDEWLKIIKKRSDNLNLDIKDEQSAYIIYTSGSTGKPKGTVITHKGLLNYCLWSAKYYPLDKGIGTTLHASVCFDGTFTSIFVPIICGKRMVIVSNGLEIESWSKILSRVRCFSFIKLTPSHLYVLNKQLADKIEKITYSLIIGGEALNPDFLKPWRNHASSVLIFDEYGPTETVVGSICCNVSDHLDNNKTLSIGKPIANTQVFILNKYLELVPIGVVGEIFIGGHGVAKGYLNQPELTNERFIENFFDPTRSSFLYKTGDFGKYLPDGEVIFFGREDNQVKIRGFRVELGHIEAVLMKHEAIQNAICLCEESKYDDKQIVAFCKFENNSKMTSNDLIFYLKKKLPGFMIPSKFVFVDQITLTKNGKVDSKALLHNIKNTINIDEEENNLPNDEIEEKLLQIWSKSLDKKILNIHSDFFYLGGHSIKAINIISEICETFNVNISIKSIFENPTIFKLSEIIRQKAKIHSNVSNKIIFEEGTV